MAQKPKPDVFTAREARQGWRGRPVLVVLIVSLVLVAAVWFAAEIWGSLNAPAPSDAPATSSPGADGQTGSITIHPPAAHLPQRGPTQNRFHDEVASDD